MDAYNSDFYNQIREGSLRSAQIIIPIVLDLLQPKSIVDVGCGDGTWLSVFREYRIEDIVGVDGEWVDKQTLQIPADCFLRRDLTQPLHLDREFDLVMSLEVAEHLPKEHAETFVDSLIRLGPCILFSAAIPYQGGTNHLNEQWQDYWTQYFQAKGYVAIDSIRKQIWNNDNVEYWYAQNILLYAKPDFLQGKPLLQKDYEQTNISMLRIVHPKLYLVLNEPQNMSLREIFPMLPSLMIRSLQGRIKRYFSI